jgi:hypothetical protein
VTSSQKGNQPVHCKAVTDTHIEHDVLLRNERNMLTGEPLVEDLILCWPGRHGFPDPDPPTMKVALLSGRGVVCQGWKVVRRCDADR